MKKPEPNGGFTFILIGEKPETPQTDFCSYSPDILLDFPLWKVCKLHDFAYRGRKLPGGVKIRSRRQADCFLLRGLLRLVYRHSIGRIIKRIKGRSPFKFLLYLPADILILPFLLTYFFIGVFISLVYFAFVALLGAFVYRANK